MDPKRESAQTRAGGGSARDSLRRGGGRPAGADRRRACSGERSAMIELYAATGLLHDFDYERHPTPAEHPFVGVAYPREHGWPEEVLHAILAHADYSGIKPETHLDRTLFACDELAGFL